MDYLFTILTNSILGFNMKSWFFLIQNHWKLGISFTTSETLCVQGDRGYCSFVCYNTSLLYRRSFGSPSKKRVKLNFTNFFLFFEGEMFRLLKKLLRFKFITYSYIIACVLRRDCNPLQFYFWHSQFRVSFKCCITSQFKHGHCGVTPYMNTFGGLLNYVVPCGYRLVGISNNYSSRLVRKLMGLIV